MSRQSEHPDHTGRCFWSVEGHGRREHARKLKRAREYRPLEDYLYDTTRVVVIVVDRKGQKNQLSHDGQQSSHPVVNRYYTVLHRKAILCYKASKKMIEISTVTNNHHKRTLIQQPFFIMDWLEELLQDQDCQKIATPLKAPRKKTAMTPEQALQAQ
jgi:hypothetical protein